MTPIYLEPDEEITTVVEKLAARSETNLALVAAANSPIFQSAVNLKLIKKEAARLSKQVSLIAKDKVAIRLAKQVGLPIFDRLGVATPAKIAPPATLPTEPISVSAPASTLPDGTPVHHYQPGQTASVATEASEIAEPGSGQSAEPAGLEPTGLSAPISVTATTSQSANPTEPAVPGPPALVTGNRTTKAISFNRPNLRTMGRSLAAAAVTVLVALIVGYVFIPRAKVTLTFKAESISQDLTLAVSTTPIDSAIAGSLLSVEKAGQITISSTGKKDIGTKATGTVTITNKYRDNSGAGKDQTFAAGTEVTDSKTGKKFKLDKEVTVGKVTFNPNTGSPIYQTSSVAVTAVESGEQSNLAPTTFTLGGALANTEAASSSAFSGGSTKLVTVLSKADIDSATTTLTDQLKNQGLEELKTKAENQGILDEALQVSVTKQSLDHAEGDLVEKAQLDLTVEAWTLAFDKQVADQRLKDQMSIDLKANQELAFAEDAQPTIGFVEVKTAKSEMVVKISGQGYVAPKIDKAALARQLKNKSKTNAESWVANSYQPISTDVTITPNWWPKRLPILSSAIEVSYGFVAE